MKHQCEPSIQCEPSTPCEPLTQCDPRPRRSPLLTAPDSCLLSRSGETQSPAIVFKRSEHLPLTHL